jgi:phosphatidate cytidylyltransferase
VKTRIITALFMAVFGIPLLIFSQYVIYPIAAGILAVFAIYEMSGVIGVRKNLALTIPAYIVALLTPIFAYFFRHRVTDFIFVGLLAIIAVMLYFFGYAVVCRGSLKFADVATHFTTFTYITVSFTAITLVRYLPYGLYCFLLVFLGSWVSDVFAYFVGFAIGKHKMIPEISPKKTWEGAVGGVFFTVVAFLVYGIIISLTTDVRPNYIVLAILGLLLSVVSIFGDLVASLIKREHGVKDYGYIFPGHGGVLDRFDSALAVSPVLFAVCMLFPPFV